MAEQETNPEPEVKESETRVQTDPKPTQGEPESPDDAALEVETTPIPIKFGLGEKVTYVRLNPENQVEKGTGKIVAALLDHTFRLVYRIKHGEKVFNVEAIAINADEAAEKTYIDHGLGIRKYSEEANAAIKTLTDEANAEIEARHTAVLGAPIAL